MEEFLVMQALKWHVANKGIFIHKDPFSISFMIGNNINNVQWFLELFSARVICCTDRRAAVNGQEAGHMIKVNVL